MSVAAFAPVSALAGGLLIGAAAVLLLAVNGRIAGITGVVAGVLPGPAASDAGGSRGWRWAFLAGLVVGAGALAASLSTAGTPALGLSPLRLVAGGLLVGYGTALAGGCTSGHGVCGLARLSPRSLVAVVTFLATAIATTTVVRHLLGWA